MKKGKPTKKSWNQLTSDQKNDVTKQLIHAGWKDSKEYNRIIFLVNPNNSIYGWNDPKW